MKLYVKMAKACGARTRCLNTGNSEWAAKWEARVMELLEEFPSGSGFDNGTKIDLDNSNDDKLVFTTAFHHVNENGMYDGWTYHTITVNPSLGLGFHLKISGRDRNGIKEYIADMFSLALDQQIAESIESQTVSEEREQPALGPNHSDFDPNQS